jgi:hypothetical protein
MPGTAAATGIPDKDHKRLAIPVSFDKIELLRRDTGNVSPSAVSSRTIVELVGSTFSDD